MLGRHGTVLGSWSQQPERGEAGRSRSLWSSLSHSLDVPLSWNSLRKLEVKINSSFVNIWPVNLDDDCIRVGGIVALYQAYPHSNWCRVRSEQREIFKTFWHFQLSKRLVLRSISAVSSGQHPSFIEQSPAAKDACERSRRGGGESNLPPDLTLGSIYATDHLRRPARTFPSHHILAAEAPFMCVKVISSLNWLSFWNFSDFHSTYVSPCGIASSTAGCRGWPWGCCRGCCHRIYIVAEEL